MYYQVARIVNTHGIRGDIKVISETDFPEKRFAPGERLYILTNDQAIPVTVKASRQNKGTHILSLEEYDNINQVESFKNHWLGIHPEQQESLGEFEFYYHEIIGLPVKTADNPNFGRVKDILSYGPNDVWVIQRSEPRKQDVLIPYIEDVVKEVNLDEQFVFIELMEGLIPDED